MELVTGEGITATLGYTPQTSLRKSGVIREDFTLRAILIQLKIQPNNIEVSKSIDDLEVLACNVQIFSG